jgi:hypothetical protein
VTFIVDRIPLLLRLVANVAENDPEPGQNKTAMLRRKNALDATRDAIFRAAGSDQELIICQFMGDPARQIINACRDSVGVVVRRSSEAWWNLQGSTANKGSGLQYLHGCARQKLPTHIETHDFGNGKPALYRDRRMVRLSVA